MSSETKDEPIVAPLPRIFGRYLLIHRLSRGGMGEIFLARYGLAGFEKLSVIKKVLPHLAADEEFIARFVTEAQVAVKLQHANIAQVFEVGRVGDEYFLALEHIHGRDLRRTLSLLVDSGRGMPPDLALFIAREVANALAYAHRRVDDDGKQLGLVHCDISPPNVMMSFEGEVKIIDFGIAKSALKAMDENSKRGFGKFGYMAPEQLIRGRKVEARTDIYALGAVLFEMLTGKRLYELGETPDYRALARMVAKGQHPVPSDHDPALAPYDNLVRQALKPKVADRFTTAAQFRDAIQRLLIDLNPTISTDELAAFMRFMFAEDVLRQQEEIERLDKTQLSQWESELTREAQQTVSFALGGALDLTRTGTDAVDLLTESEASELSNVDVDADADDATELLEKAAASSVSASSSAELDARPLGDRTEIIGLADPVPERRGRRLGWIMAAVLLFGIGAAFAYTKFGASGSLSASQAAATKVAVAQSDAGDASTAELPNASQVAEVAANTQPDPDAIVSDDSSDSNADPAPGSGADTRDTQTRDTTKVDRTRDNGKTKKTDADARTGRADATVVSAARSKFRAANKEYTRFRQKHGGQLHGEWTALLQYATFAKNNSKKAPALVKKIDGFRAKMRKIQRDTL